MANVDMTTGGAKQLPATGYGAACNVRIKVDWADVLSGKGSALAAGDLIQIMDVPIATWVFTGIIHANEVASGVTQLDLNLGWTDDDNEWQDAYDATDITSVGTALWVPTFFASADTVDVDIHALTGTLADGSVNVEIMCCSLYADILAANK